MTSVEEDSLSILLFAGEGGRNFPALKPSLQTRGNLQSLVGDTSQ
jgi:hypothetical protein